MRGENFSEKERHSLTRVMQQGDGEALQEKAEFEKLAGRRAPFFSSFPACPHLSPGLTSFFSAFYFSPHERERESRDEIRPQT